MDINFKRLLYCFICFGLCVTLIGCHGNVSEEIKNGKKEDVYKNKNMDISFNIPKTWEDKYKIIHMKDSSGIKKVIFQKKDKKYKIILLELWLVNENQLDEWKDVRKLNVIKKTDKGIIAYSKPRLESIIENIGSNVGSKNKELEKGIREMYLSKDDIMQRIN
ncbi:hypothetical protein [Hathewaya massiliensis]|uniref:hypothetical protein n=1 Tax=Hathewaya massiliensis TaxID=1964382 RepID=UPI001159AFF5|nr:hypothetical protein [Hathewaya massiliensis]